MNYRASLEGKNTAHRREGEKEQWSEHFTWLTWLGCEINFPLSANVIVVVVKIKNLYLFFFALSFAWHEGCRLARHASLQSRLNSRCQFCFVRNLARCPWENSLESFDATDTLRGLPSSSSSLAYVEAIPWPRVEVACINSMSGTFRFS